MLKSSVNFGKPTIRTSLIVAAFSIGMMATYPAAAQRVGASTQAVSSFLANPSEVMNKSPTGGAELVSGVRDLVTADPATLQPILNLLANANKDQKTAIGSALAQAAKIVVRTNPAFATEIQQAILNTRDQDVVLAFAAGSGDAPIGAAGAGGGAGGASGGQTSPLPLGNGSGGPQTIGQAGVNTPNFSYTSSVAGLGAISNTTGAVAAEVSP